MSYMTKHDLFLQFIIDNLQQALFTPTVHVNSDISISGNRYLLNCISSVMTDNKNTLFISNNYKQGDEKFLQRLKITTRLLKIFYYLFRKSES